MHERCTYVYGDEQSASVLLMSHRKTPCTVEQGNFARG